MKIKQEIEWVVGENPGEPSLKLIAIEHAGKIEVTIGSFGHFDRISEPRWNYANHAEIPIWGSAVIAWSNIPEFKGLPTECQKVEFDDANKRCQKHQDPVVERLIEAVGILGKESERRLWSEFEDPDHKYGSELDKLKHLDVYVRTGKVEA